MVIARRGTYCSPKKSLAASIRVTRSRVISRVRLSRAEPGSLKPMWPVRPMPRSWMSIPPAVGDRLLVGVAELAAPRSIGSVPSGMWMFSRRDVDVVEEVLVHEAVVALQLVPLHGVSIRRG